MALAESIIVSRKELRREKVWEFEGQVRIKYYWDSHGDLCPFETTSCKNRTLSGKFYIEEVEVEEGEGRLAGTLGAIHVRYRDGNIVKVGSGFSDWHRNEIWQNQIYYIGKIVEIQYFEETKNDKGGVSLRFPIFKDIRLDKLTADY